MAVCSTITEKWQYYRLPDDYHISKLLPCREIKANGEPDLGSKNSSIIAIVKNFDVDENAREDSPKKYPFRIVHIHADHNLVYADYVDEEFHDLTGRGTFIKGEIVDICRDVSISAVNLILEKKVKKIGLVEQKSFKVKAIRTVRGKQDIKVENVTNQMT
jgi:hypothetical protein